MEIDIYIEWLGLPEGPRPPDHYQLLGLKPSEDCVITIRAAFVRAIGMVRTNCQNLNAPECQDLMNRLSQAMCSLINATAQDESNFTPGGDYDLMQPRWTEDDFIRPRV